MELSLSKRLFSFYIMYSVSSFPQQTNKKTHVINQRRKYFHIKDNGFPIFENNFFFDLIWIINQKMVSPSFNLSLIHTAIWRSAQSILFSVPPICTAWIRLISQSPFVLHLPMKFKIGNEIIVNGKEKHADRVKAHKI